MWRPKGKKNSIEIQEAYETLSDPEKRATYDQQFIEKPVFKKRIYDSPDRVDLTSNLFDEIDHLETIWSITHETSGPMNRLGRTRQRRETEMLNRMKG